jgi:hypothetical protein
VDFCNNSYQGAASIFQVVFSQLFHNWK